MQQGEDSELIKFLETKELSSDPTEAKVVLSQAKKGYYVVEEYCTSVEQICQTVGGW